MSEHSIDVVAVGTLAVDYFALLHSIPGPEEKVVVDGYEVHPGGVAGNVVTQLARLGISAAWAGKIGDDDTGSILLEQFKQDGVCTDYVEIVEGKHSMFTWIQVDKKGDRSITMFPNVLHEYTAEDVEQKHREVIAGARILQVEACLLPLKPVLKAMEIAKENGVTVVFDLDVSPRHFIEEAGLATRDEMDRAIQLADVFIPCKAAASELIGSVDFEDQGRKLLDYGPATCAVTLGSRGCIVFNRDEFHHVDGNQVDVVDTTGAGDAFHGGFIYGLINDFPLNKIGEIANACGAECCKKVGARSMGTLDEVMRFIDR